MTPMTPVDDAAAREAVRRAIRADLERLGAPARGRYRAALRRLIREAEGADAPPEAPAPPVASEGELAMIAVGAVGVVTAAVLGGPAAGAMVGACAAGVLACSMILKQGGGPRDVRRFHLDDQPADVALHLHRAAMAQSRRDYYAGAHSRGV